MTDEEKAEEYVKNKILEHNQDLVLRPKNAITYIDELKQTYLDGLAEGRQETESHLLENWCRNEDGYCPHLKQLEKENAKLKAHLQEVTENRDEEKADKHTIKYWLQFIKENNDEADINFGFSKIIEIAKQLEKENAELKAQIEKMRCCGNCKNNYSCHYESIDELARIDCEKDLKSWELKE